MWSAKIKNKDTDTDRDKVCLRKRQIWYFVNYNFMNLTAKLIWTEKITKLNSLPAILESSFNKQSNGSFFYNKLYLQNKTMCVRTDPRPTVGGNTLAPNSFRLLLLLFCFCFCYIQTATRVATKQSRSFRFFCVVVVVCLLFLLDGKLLIHFLLALLMMLLLLLMWFFLLIAGLFCLRVVCVLLNWLIYFVYR